MTDISREKYIKPYTDFSFKTQAEIAQYDDIERRQYEASLKEYWDYTSTLETAEQKGESKRAKEIARRMKAKGVSLEEIAELTDLSIEEIKFL